MSRALIKPILAAGLWLLLPALLVADAEVERTVDAAPGGRVEISNVAGSVRVIGWDRDQVQVDATLGQGVEELVVERSGDTVEIEVRPARRSRWAASARLEVRVPRGSELEVDTVSAGVEVAEVAGRVKAESVSGSVEVAGGPAAVDVETVSGSIEADVQTGRVAVETVSGSVKLSGTIGEVEIETVSGRIGVASAALRRAELSTNSGRIGLAGALEGRAQIRAGSHSGSIELALPASTSARFEVSTFSGRIDNQLGPPPKKTRYGPGKELEFALGGGEARVTVETFSGSVTLRRN